MIDLKRVKNEKDNDNPLNNLPEYEVRTMKDDLDRASGKEIEPRIEKLKVPELKPEAKIEPKIELTPPEELPILSTLQEKLLEKKEPLRAPLPSMEEFISPLQQPIVPLEEAETEIKKEKKEKKKEFKKPRKKGLFIITAIIIIVIAALAGFFYWQGTKPEPLPPPPPPPSGLQIPEPLISVDKTQKILLENNSLLTLLKTEAKSVQTAQTIRRIMPINSLNSEEKEILSLNDLIQDLRIAVYPYVLSELKNNYTLVFYAQGTKNLLGIIIETTNPIKLNEQLRFWEKTMSEDLKNLFLDEKRGEPISKNFKDNTYKEVAIRYINFPDPNLTIDYALFGNLFILSTSKESMYEIIDKIKP